MIVDDALWSRGLTQLSFFERTRFGVAVLANAIVFMPTVGRNALSRQTIAQEDLLGSYGLADKWRRLLLTNQNLTHISRRTLCAS